MLYYSENESFLKGIAWFCRIEHSEEKCKRLKESTLGRKERGEN